MEGVISPRTAEGWTWALGQESLDHSADLRSLEYVRELGCWIVAGPLDMGKFVEKVRTGQ